MGRIGGRIIIPEILRGCCGGNLAAKSVVDNYVDKYVDNFGGIVDNFWDHIGSFYRIWGGIY